ncbi:hypothetical protein [Streptomyces sp. RKAG293]|uniref:hypothetical protein n=1 Tax=Streptomyces sp. RKAG293 TaxID=2893403 RepID=UPI0020348FC4|nr:hypothetical protein [Streptomyces sp. RKAG293]MCM2424247.1 hypothetical protein [Streptomyces sp. RKAG293]
MTAALPPIDHDKSPLIDADHDVVRIADALRASPHIRSVTAAEPGEETIWFTDDHGTGFALALTGEEPCADDPQTVAYTWDAVAAAIGNHPHFVHAELARDGFGPEKLDTITARTRTGNEYTLKLTVGLPPHHGVPEEPPVAVADILHAVGQLRAHLTSDPAGVTLNAAADLLEHIAGTWDQQDDQTRQRAYVLALSL